MGIRDFVRKVMRRNVITSESLLKDLTDRGMICRGGVRWFSRVSVGEPYMIQIGENVTVSTDVNFVTHDNSAIKIFENGTDFVGKIKIGDNCFIGTGSIILPGVSLANNTIVGAGSVVTKSVVEEGTVVAGNPAKKVSSVAELKSKNSDLVFDFCGKSEEEKKYEILSRPEKWVKR